jgi:spore germination protein KB
MTRRNRMIKEGKFGLFEAICLTTLIIVPKIFYTTPMVLTRDLGTAAWYGTLISCISSIIFFMLLYLLMKRFPGKNLVEVFEASLGKILGKAAAIILFGYFLYYCGANVREFLEMLKAFILPYTPPSIILFAFLSVVALIAFYGLEAVSRLAYICFLPVIGGLLIILVLASPHYQTDLFKPYLGHGLGKTLIIGIFRSSAYSEVIILAIIINSIHGLKNLKKAGIISLILSGLTISLTMFCYIITFGYSVGSENVSGVYLMSRIIYFTRFFQRIESVFLFLLVISSVVMISVVFYIALSIYCKTFSISNHRPLILPFLFLVFMIALLPNNISETIQYHMLFVRQYSGIILYGLPVLALLVSIVLGRKGGKAKHEKA